MSNDVLTRECGLVQVDKAEVSGPEAEAAIARITQQPPSTPQQGTSASDPHASKPTTSALAEHDAAFPAIGAMNGIAAPGKSGAAVNGSASVVATIGDESTYAPGALDAALETAPSAVSVSLTVGDEGKDVLVALTLDGAEGYVPYQASLQHCHAGLMQFADKTLLHNWFPVKQTHPAGCALTLPASCLQVSAVRPVSDWTSLQACALSVILVTTVRDQSSHLSCLHCSRCEVKCHECTSPVTVTVPPDICGVLVADLQTAGLAHLHLLHIQLHHLFPHHPRCRTEASCSTAQRITGFSNLKFGEDSQLRSYPAQHSLIQTLQACLRFC